MTVASSCTEYVTTYNNNYFNYLHTLNKFNVNNTNEERCIEKYL